MDSHRDATPRALPPRGADLDQPNPARIYDYALGGSANFAADRAAFDALAAVYPDSALAARSNRAFLRRAVTFLARQGIDQFLDVGSCLPTTGTVHEVARSINPAARVVYVDNDPVAARFSRNILAEDDIDGVAAIEADLRDPAAILAHPRTRRLLDLGRPIGLLIVAVLHFIPDDDQATAAVRTLTAALAGDSYRAIAHGTYDGTTSDTFREFARLYEETTHPLGFRPRATVESFFAGFALVEPGLVFAPTWWPAGANDPLRDEPGRAPNWAGIGRKPSAGLV